MTLENMLLEKLSEWQPSPGRQELYLTAEGWGVTVTADRSDALGCLAWELNLRREGTAGVPLQPWAAAASRVSGLMEPLKVIEIDSSRNEAQLRSESPSQRGAKRLYYELVLSGLGSAVLRRFQTAEAAISRREQVVFAVTHESLAKLAGDLMVAAA
jgi:hypothetical protein